MFYEFSCSSGVISTALILTAWGQHDTDLNNLAYKTRCDSTVADAALRVGVESRRSFARWMVFLMREIVKKQLGGVVVEVNEDKVKGQGCQIPLSIVPSF